jgi:hypothetical protein
MGKKSRSYISQDEVGWYAYLEEHGKIVCQTLRTPDRTKAIRWCDQGDCHGWKNHDKPCKDCRE